MAAASTMVGYLLERLGVEPLDVDRLYISGAFGTYINLESAITIGLYPDLPRERFVSLGNSSLKGAYALLTDGDKMEEVAMLQERIEYLNPAPPPILFRGYMPPGFCLIPTLIFIPPSSGPKKTGTLTIIKK